MDYSEQTIEDAKSREKRLEGYFGMVKAVLREPWLQKPTSWAKLERDLKEALLTKQNEVRGAEGWDAVRACMRGGPLRGQGDGNIMRSGGERPVGLHLPCLLRTNRLLTFSPLVSFLPSPPPSPAPRTRCAPGA